MNDRERLIKESKERCRKLGLNPEAERLNKIFSNKELTKKQEQNQFFINAALPYMTLMAATFKECGSLLALIDKECYILKLMGTARVLKSRKKFGIVEGTSLSEEHAGTNAAAICLKTQKPFRISGEEYFLKLLQRSSCFAAPIIEENVLLGAVIIIHPKKSDHPHTFVLVQTLAKLIAREYQEITQGNFIISVCDSLNSGILFTEKNGYIWYANLRARHILQIKKDENINNHFNINLFASAKFYNEIVYSKHTKKTFLTTRKRYNNKFLFLFEPLEDELKKEEKLKTTLAPYNFEDIIGLVAIKRKARQLALQNVNILIIGESGTGKELLASAIHNTSPRAGARFVVVNCAAIPETLFESELFGYKKGAFTDARFDRIGRIEYALGGTLFLDEIGDLPLNIQSKLLRVIEDNYLIPLGGNEPKRVDVRFIFATNQDLEKLVRQKNFRGDLYYRISTPIIKIPPLRERKHEIPNFIDHFIHQIQNDHQRFVAGIADASVRRLMEHSYPGNVRELKGILKNAYLTCQGERIEVEDLEILHKDRSIKLKGQLADRAVNIIKERLFVNNNNVKITARELGISARTIYRYLKNR